MINLVPWTVTVQLDNGKRTVEGLYAPISISPKTPQAEVVTLLGIDDGEVISMIRGDHTSAAIVFQQDDDE